MYNKIQELIIKNNIEIIHVEGANMGQYVQNIVNLPKILAPHDSPARRMFELFKGEKNLIQKLQHYLRWKKYINYEKNTYAQFNHCIVVSHEDKEALQKNLPNLNISVIANGVDTDYYSYGKVQPDKNTVIFTGNMSYPPNVDAVMYFYHEILPLIRKSINDIKFYVVGANPNGKILNLRNDRSVTITGKVADIRKYIYKSSVYVSPMRFGTGIKNKILEAMSMGIPIIATKESTAGIDASSEKELIIADDKLDFAEKTIKLLYDSKKRLFLANNARKLIENNYSWTRKVKLFESIYQNALTNKGGYHE